MPPARALTLLTILVSTVPHLAQAQQPGKVPRIGILAWASPTVISKRVEALRQRLGDLGYVEGKTIAIEYRYGEGKRDRLDDLAAELVRLNVDVIVTGGSAPALAAKNATTKIPIVFSTANDPVGDKLVSSLARPGGNITGLSIMAPDLDGKRLELLKEAFPNVVRVAFLMPRGTRAKQILKEMDRTAGALGLKLLSLELQDLEDLEIALARAKRQRAEALITTLSGQIATQRHQVLDFAAKYRLPAIYPYSEFVQAGGLMSYAPVQTNSWQRAADIVDKILKGTKPADIPVENPKKFEFLVNLKTAKQIGFAIPPNVLARADRVIR